MGEDINKQFEKLYQVFIQQLQVVLPPSTNIPVAYESGTDEEQNFVQNLALFLTAFFKVHLACCTVVLFSLATYSQWLFISNILPVTPMTETPTLHTGNSPVSGNPPGSKQRTAKTPKPCDTLIGMHGGVFREFGLASLALNCSCM